MAETNIMTDEVKCGVCGAVADTMVRVARNPDVLHCYEHRNLAPGATLASFPIKEIQIQTGPAVRTPIEKPTLPTENVVQLQNTVVEANPPVVQEVQHDQNLVENQGTEVHVPLDVQNPVVVAPVDNVVINTDNSPKRRGRPATKRPDENLINNLIGRMREFLGINAKSPGEIKKGIALLADDEKLWKYVTDELQENGSIIVEGKGRGTTWKFSN